MALHYGVTPQHMPMVNDIQQVVTQTDALLVERQLVQAGDRVVIVAGWSPATPGTMNGMVIHTIGTSWTAVPSQQVMRQMLKAEKE
jgi:pyruvate kinase